VLPRASFRGPRHCHRGQWTGWQSFAKDEAGDLALLTAHHYITGQGQSAATIDVMLQEEKKYQPMLVKFQAISESARIPWRMCETASFSGGGKAGVSDTFASALWALDYLFVLSSYGCSGRQYGDRRQSSGRDQQIHPDQRRPSGPSCRGAGILRLVGFRGSRKGRTAFARAGCGRASISPPMPRARARM